MSSFFLTSLQLVGIGFSFGIIGPCFLVCTPILIAYVAGSKRRLSEALSDAGIFLFGRLLAYILLGGLAGISGGLLRHFTGSHLNFFLRPAAGAVSILLGFLVFRYYKKADSPGCHGSHANIYNSSGLFMLGFLIGITPCAPLAALLVEIMLMSKSAFEGAFYAFFFGLGSVISGLVVISALSGLLVWLPPKILKSKTSDLVFRTLCALLLVLMGLGLILGGYSYSAHG